MAEGEEYARSFARTPGTIGEEGVVLTRATWWVPHFGEDLLDFDLTSTLPEGWDASARARAPTKDATGAVGVRPSDGRGLPDREPVHRYERVGRRRDGQAFLREPDAEPREPKYLEATAQYVEMYREPDRPLSVREVRAGRELLGDRLRHAVVHAARAAR